MERRVEFFDVEPLHRLLPSQKGRVDAGKLGKVFDHTGPGQPFEALDPIHDLHEHLVGLSYDDKVKEGFVGRGVEHEGTASHDYGAVRPLLSPHGDSPEGEHVEHVGDVQLIGEGKTHHVHACQGSARLQRGEGDAYPLKY